MAIRSGRGATAVAMGAAVTLAPGAIQAFTAPAVQGSTGQSVRLNLRGAESASAAAPSQSSSASTCALAAGSLTVAAAALSAPRRSRRTTVAPAAVTAPRESRIPMAAGAVGAKKRVLIMGGTRFIGTYLVKKLRDLGHEVVLVNRGKTNGGKPEPLPGMSAAEYAEMLREVSVLVADRKEPAAVKAAIAGAGHFDIVFDNNVRKLAEIQPVVEGIEASGGCEQFFVMSSAGVYGATDVLPLSEATPGDPNSRHKEKLACENFLASKGVPWTSIRPVYIYGPLNYNPVERFFFDRVARGRPICVPFGGKYITQLGHCEDLAEFMVQCIGNPNVIGEVYNISGEEFVSFDGMAQLCAEAAGAPEPQIVYYDPKEVDVPEGFPKAFPFRGMHFFAGISKAKQACPGWRPKYSLLEGLRASYKEDYCARGFDKKDPDYRTDDVILGAKGISAAGAIAAAEIKRITGLLANPSIPPAATEALRAQLAQLQSQVAPAPAPVAAVSAPAPAAASAPAPAAAPVAGGDAQRIKDLLANPSIPPAAREGLLAQLARLQPGAPEITAAAVAVTAAAPAAAAATPAPAPADERCVYTKEVERIQALLKNRSLPPAAVQILSNQLAALKADQFKARY